MQLQCFFKHTQALSPHYNGSRDIYHERQKVPAHCQQQKSYLQCPAMSCSKRLFAHIKLAPFRSPPCLKAASLCNDSDPPPAHFAPERSKRPIPESAQTCIEAISASPPLQVLIRTLSALHSAWTCQVQQRPHRTTCSSISRGLHPNCTSLAWIQS